MSAIGMTQTVLATGFVEAMRRAGIGAELADDQLLAPAVQSWLRDVATALIEAERGDPPQTRGLRKDIAVEVSQDRILNPPRPARTNLGRRESDR